MSNSDINIKDLQRSVKDLLGRTKSFCFFNIGITIFSFISSILVFVFAYFYRESLEKLLTIFIMIGLLIIVSFFVSFILGIRCFASSRRCCNLLNYCSDADFFIEEIEKTASHLKTAVVIYLIFMFIPFLGIVSLLSFIFIFVMFFELKRHNRKLMRKYGSS